MARGSAPSKTFGWLTEIVIGLASAAGSRVRIDEEEELMAWTKPALKEISCGMEINMYAPAEDEPVLF
ncbi:pyrroloquinoline quinone precursor peptide PqqA [Paracoccus aestuariivivens]